MKHRNTRASFLAAALLLVAGAFLPACDASVPTAEESAEATRILLSLSFWKNATVSDVRELLERGADPDAKYDDYGSFRGYAPLHMAASSGNAEVVKVLIKAGVDLNAKFNGNTARDLAERATHIYIADLLRRAGAPSAKESDEATRTLLSGSFWGNATGSDVWELLKAGADLKATTPDGTTTLHMAAWSGNAKMIKMLLKAGADPKATNNYGATPLHTAARFYQAKAVKMLLEAGADPKATNENGETPLHVAANSYLGKANARFEEIAEILRRADG